MDKIFKKIGTWGDSVSDWWFWHWETVVFITVIVAVIVGGVLLVMYASGAFYDEVENYDFTAQVYDKDHYTTHSVSYIGKTRTPVYHTHHHYKVMWENDGVREAFEVGADHYDLIKIGDFINVHCSVRADKQGELHYYYSFKGY